jgi:N-acyl amino acid synthase of PEP-CTERM/exosortase system
MQSNTESGSSLFDDQFEVILADDEYSRSIHYQLRYQVYCLEEGFEDQSHFSDGEEKDQWDDRSVHFLVRSKHSSEWVAAMRMVIPETGKLPIEQMCDIDPVVMPSFPERQIAEISRMCIVDSHRRKQLVDSVAGNPGNSQDTTALRIVPDTRETGTGVRVHKSIIMKGLLRAAATYSQDHNIPFWYFLTTPALARIISRLNVQLIRVGAAYEHRGTRYPFLANIRQAVAQAKKGCPDMAATLYSKTAAYTRFTERGIPAREMLDEDYYQVA